MKTESRHDANFFVADKFSSAGAPVTTMLAFR